MNSESQNFWSRYNRIKGIDDTSVVRVFEATRANALDANGGDRVYVYEIQHSDPASSTAVSRAILEVKRLAELKEERLTSPLEIESSADFSRVVVPFCDQVRLSDRLSSGLTICESLEIAGCLLQILDSVHKAGLVLRCLRPEDIILHEVAGTLSVSIAGCPPLLLLNPLDGSPVSNAVIKYAAPETLGVLEHGIDASADLYSLGMILFECLCGKLPFAGETTRELMIHHAGTSVPRLQDLNPDVPPELSAIIQCLLQKQPRYRYRSTAGARFDIEQISNAYGQQKPGGSAPPTVLGAQDQRESLIEPAYVGRDRHLVNLKSALKDVKSGDSQTILVTAPSGLGKTRFIQEASTIALMQGYRILRIQGSSLPGLSPFAAMEPMDKALSGYITENSNLRAQLHEVMQDYASELHAVVPELAVQLGLVKHEYHDRLLNDRRIAMAVSTLVANVASADAPVMLLVDDAQWLDNLTQTILDGWQVAAPRHTLMVVSSQPASEIVVRLNKHQEIASEVRLTALGRNDSDMLLNSMAGKLPTKILDAVWQLAHGSPFLSSVVLRGLVEGKVLSPYESERQVDDSELHKLQTNQEASDVLKQRIARLSSESRQLLTVGAVLGKTFSTQVVADISSTNFDSVFDTLVDPRDRRLIQETVASGVWHFVHDQIRDTVLQSVSPEELATIHLLVANYIAANTPENYFKIASHYDAAGCPTKALPFAIQAGRAALERHALEVAEQQYSIALRSCKDASSGQLFEILNGMGNVLYLSGHRDDAEALLTKALQQADKEMDKAEIGLKLGELAFIREDKDAAIRCWETAQRNLGGQLPNKWLIPFYALKEVAVQTLHSVFPRLLVKSKNHTATLRARLTCRLYSRLASAYLSSKRKSRLLFAHLRGMNLAETIGSDAELAQVYLEHAPLMNLIPLRRRGIAYVRKSLDIRTETNDVCSQEQGLVFLAAALYSAGQYAECIEVGRRSVRILDAIGDFRGKHVIQYQVAASLLRIGRLTEAVQLAREVYESGIVLGDDQACGNIIDIWSRATNGDLPQDIVLEELDRPRADALGRAHVLLARGVQLIAEHRFTDSANAFDEGITLCRSAGITNCYTAPFYAWKSTAVRRFLEIDSPLIRKSRQRTIRGHRKAAWLAVLVALRFRSELPHALRELAWSFIFQNRIRRAIRVLKWSICAANAQSAHYEKLQSDLILQQVCGEYRNGDSGEQLRDAEARLSAFEEEQLPKRVPMSLSLVDRFDSLLESGRTIATATELSQIIERTMVVCKKMLRSDFCRFVPIDSDGQPAEGIESLIGLVTSCVNSGVATVVTGPTKEHRSLIGCPLTVRGSVFAVVVVGNTEVRDLFSDNDRRVISYISTICGNALENAEGFLNLQRLNESLEDIVSERTAVIEARSRQLQNTADHLRQTQVDLAAARDVAESANQAKTDFLAHISHEIRTPIGAILGFTEMVQRSSHGLHPDQSQQLAQVQSNGNHLSQLLNDLLDLSKIEAGQLTVELIQTGPFRLISDTLASLESRAIDKGLKLSLTICNHIPETIRTDPTRLRQIVTNLVGNAIKFTSHGSVEVLVETHREDELIKVHIKDSGSGIPTAAQPSVFEPFQQADESINRTFGGTGLGLPISRTLARALGGDISLISEPAEGSTFTVTVATGSLDGVSMLNASEAVSQTAPKKPVGIVELDLTGISVLIADDISANREFFSHTLSNAGATVRIVDDGQQVLDAWSRCSCDLILMDLRMPVMDGYTAAEILREEGVQVPIVALTANALSVDEELCLSIGFTRYLTKPISMDSLLAEVADLVGRPKKSLEFAESQPTIIPDTSPVRLRIEGAMDVPKDPFFRNLAAQLLTKLVDSTPNIANALDEDDMEFVAEQAHWMKGTGGTVGLPIITSIAKELETAAKSHDASYAKEVLHNLNEVIGQLEVSLST